VSGAAELLGLLAEPDRLRVAAALVLGAATTAEVAAATGLPPRVALRALTRLTAGGLVSAGKDGWRFHPELLTEAARAAAPPPDESDHGASDAREASVLRTFLRDARLVTIPAAAGKRRVVLGHLARLFEVGRTYPEREVDAALREFHPDHAALRRYLVDEGLLSREAGRLLAQRRAGRGVRAGAVTARGSRTTSGWAYSLVPRLPMPSGSWPSRRSRRGEDAEGT